MVTASIIALFPILGRKDLVFFSIRYDTSYRFFIDGLYQIEEVPFYSYLVENFLTCKKAEFCQNFFAPLEMIMWVLFFILLTWCITLIDFQILNQPCIPGLNSAWFYVLLDSVY